MFRTAFCSALLLSALLAGSSAAHAENRLALVIGESAYRAVPSLPNPANDARAMSKLLTDSGFEVTTAADLSQKELNQKVGDFTADIAAKGPDTVVLVFYAGHGLQIDGENYLVPVDVDPKREADIPLQAVRLNDVLNTLNSVPTRMRILLLDACRNNPFPALNQTVGRGLALVDTKTGAPGTFLSYSTSPGAEAEDGQGSDSPYTTALMTAARTPGLPIEQAFKQVRVAVNKATDGRQTPWESSSLTEDFKFVAATDARDANAALPPPASNAPKRSVDQWKRDLQGKQPDAAHEMIVADGTLEAYQAYDATVCEVAVRARGPRVDRSPGQDAGMEGSRADQHGRELSLVPGAISRHRPHFYGAHADRAAALQADPGGAGSAPSTPARRHPRLLLTSQPKKTELAPAIDQTPVVIKKVDVTPPVIIRKVDVTPPRRSDPPVRTLPPSRGLCRWADLWTVPADVPPAPLRPRLWWWFSGGMMGRPMGFPGRRY